ncbi:MAG: peptidoglycan-binding protein, partial [Desulfobacteraceae bacterium]|nr:peptidoglycan-binding protein [Desulfobacteraceae bacterium]
YGLQKGKQAILLFSVLCVAFFMVILFRPGFLDVNAIFNPSKNKKSDISPSDHVKTAVLTPPATDSEIIRRPEAKESESVVETVKNPDKTSESVAESVENYEGVAPAPDLGDFLGKINGPSSRHMALEAVMDLWKTESGIKPYLNDVEDDRTFFRLAAKQNGLLIHRVQSHLNLIKKLNLPSILAFYLPGKVSPVYLTLSKTDARIIALRGGDEVIAVKPSDLETYWSGVAYIPWKNFFSLTGTIPLNSPNDSIITLKMLLQDIGFNEVEISPDYDEQTQQAVKEIQKKHGIKVDALVGPLTKMVLYNEKKSLGIPHITP